MKDLKRMHTLRHDRCQVDKLTETDMKVCGLAYLKTEKLFTPLFYHYSEHVGFLLR